LIKLIRLSFRQNQCAPQTTIDFYRIGKVLGKGAFGKVNLAVHKLTECLCAVKSINKQYFSDESQSKKVMQEVVMLKRTKHKNIVRLYEYFETEKHLLFVIELCAGGDLLNYVRRRRRLKEDVAKCLFKQIIESLAYCHCKNILHRDIKLDNILLDADGDVKICDFGVGKIVKKGEKMTEQCGTPAYIAPEILLDKGYYGFGVDIWSAGVVLYAMLYGTVPFKANNMSELQSIIIKAKYSLKEDISLEARDLLRGMMEKDPNKRLSVSQILQHKWLEDVQDSRNIELFTEQEKQCIRNEFTYHKSKRYNRNFDTTGLAGLSDALNQNAEPSELDKDMFTEHMLDTTQNSTLKNCETKSVILAPFNSTKSNLNLDENGHETQTNVELSDSIKELIVTRRIIKFGARVRDIDRQYEINNNADLDNGVYHKFDEEEQKNEQEEVKSEEDNSKSQENLKNEDSEIMLDEEEQEILKELKKQGQKKKNQNDMSEIQRLENMIHDQEEQIEDGNKFMLLSEVRQLDRGGGNLNTENS
jgi:serine/threonine protein kinase